MYNVDPRFTLTPNKSALISTFRLLTPPAAKTSLDSRIPSQSIHWVSAGPFLDHLRDQFRTNFGGGNRLWHGVRRRPCTLHSVARGSSCPNSKGACLPNAILVLHCDDAFELHRSAIHQPPILIGPDHARVQAPHRYCRRAVALPCMRRVAALQSGVVAPYGGVILPLPRCHGQG